MDNSKFCNTWSGDISDGLELPLVGLGWKGNGDIETTQDNEIDKFA
jgi:hypothetical protein